MAPTCSNLYQHKEFLETTKDEVIFSAAVEKGLCTLLTQYWNVNIIVVGCSMKNRHLQARGRCMSIK